jgi:hypothetical protein
MTTELLDNLLKVALYGVHRTTIRGSVLIIDDKSVLIE